jgi:hypothetical protein
MHLMLPSPTGRGGLPAPVQHKKLDNGDADFVAPCGFDISR